MGLENNPVPIDIPRMRKDITWIKGDAILNPNRFPHFYLKHHIPLIHIQRNKDIFIICPANQRLGRDIVETSDVLYPFINGLKLSP